MINIQITFKLHSSTWAGPVGDRQAVETPPLPPPPPEKSQKYRVSSNTDLDSLKNNKATKPAFNVGPSLARLRNAI